MSNALEKIESAQRHYHDNIPFETDGGLGARAAIGLIVLGSDQTVEHEFRILTDIEGVALYQSPNRKLAHNHARNTATDGAKDPRLHRLDPQRRSS